MSLKSEDLQDDVNWESIAPRRVAFPTVRKLVYRTNQFIDAGVSASSFPNVRP
jgi:hypothetical protein